MDFFLSSLAPLEKSTLIDGSQHNSPRSAHSPSSHSVEVAHYLDCDGTAAALAQDRKGEAFPHQKLEFSAALGTPPATALAVLTDPVLWCIITSLMTEWPFPVYQLWKERAPKYTLHDPSHWSWGRDQKFSLKRGAIPHVATAENNRKVLELVVELCKIPLNRDNSLLDMSHVMACAAHHDRLEMLRWMVETAKKESEWRVWEGNLMFHPVRRHDFDMMSFLYENLPRDKTRIEYPTLKQAVWNSNLELVQWVYDRNYEFSE